MRWLRRLLCALKDHAGMSPTYDQRVWKCKKCGALVRL
jgi:hypothetical protein